LWTLVLLPSTCIIGKVFVGFYYNIPSHLINARIKMNYEFDIVFSLETSYVVV